MWLFYREEEMSRPSSMRKGEGRGTVLQSSRRRAIVWTSEGTIVPAPLVGRTTEPCVGDEVVIRSERNELAIASVEERRSLLRRSYEGRTKQLAANVDKLFVVAAIEPLFNRHMIDRAIVAAQAEGIPVLLVCNKIDIDPHAVSEEVRDTYARIGVELLFTSCRSGEGMSAVEDAIFGGSVRHAVFCGISGVGKSSLLNRLVPDALRAVGEVSRKTGQGKQTTSAAMGVPVVTGDGVVRIITDTPGLQHFGLTHLPSEGLITYFPDLYRYAEHCGFRDCRHLAEPSCEVREALKRGDVLGSRYESFRHIEEEIRGAERYR